MQWGLTNEKLISEFEKFILTLKYANKYDNGIALYLTPTSNGTEFKVKRFLSLIAYIEQNGPTK